MKKNKTIILLMGLVLAMGTSCSKFLDINTNPNAPTTTTLSPELILPQALTATASTLNGYNSYGAQLVGYSANAGGYGGFGESISYNFSNSSFTGLWVNTYDNLEDYQTIINKTSSQLSTYGYYNGVARIMKAYDFQLLVDAYNSIPYSEALKGDASFFTPKYDDPAKIYASLASQIDSAITIINAANAASGTVKALGSYDVLFGGDATLWKKFANTIKLRLLIRGAGKATFANSTFDAAGFLTTDALINPGYLRDNGKQNPAWSTWGFSYTGTDATKSWIPSTFVFGFYDGHILNDSWRGKAIYYQYPSTGTNRLGYENVSVPKCPSGSFWYSGTNRVGASAGTSIGILKGPDAGYPAITAAESYFLQAEGVLKGIITGDTKTLFNAGITASFNYLYQLPSKTVSGSPSTDATAYITANSGSYLANFDLATTADQKLEAIITQKYVALNFVNSHEAWNEYRRTQYPKIVANGNANQTFASTVSESTRADKLPTRILYPASEAQYNPDNAISVSPFTSLIFWAKQ